MNNVVHFWSIVLLGPPGSGKGTQAEKLSDQFNLKHIATGDLFRYNFKNETDLGKLAKTYMDKGNLVPNDVTVAMVKERLSQPDVANGVMFDGFPRNCGQAEALDKMLAADGRSLTGVLYLNVPDEEIIMRLSGRLTCRNCQATYHRIFNPPKVEGVCDVCGGELYQRADDSKETVTRRLEIYKKNTAPLIEHYRKQGILVEVNGVGTPAEIALKMNDAIATLKRI